MGGQPRAPTELPVPGPELRILRRLGVGVTSRAFFAEREGREVVLKLGRDPGLRPRFADEAERMCLVDSPWVAELLDVALLEREANVAGEVVPRGAPLLVYAFEPGEPLSQLAPEPAGRAELALRVARDLGAALADLHGAGSAHGDIKPENVVFSAAAGARLIDFGLSGEASAETAAGGTRRYLAPETFGGDLSDARRRDLFALGMLLSDLLLGEPCPAEQARARLVGEGDAGELALALLAAAPSARPSAAWVSRRAALRLGAFAEVERAGERSVHRAYRAAQRSSLLSASRAAEVSFALGPKARALLAPSLDILRKVRELRGHSAEGHVELAELDAVGRARFAIALVGIGASAWPPLAAQADDALLEAARLAVQGCLPQALGYLDFEQGAEQSRRPLASADPVALALALREPGLSELTLEAAEQALRASASSLSLRLELTRALRLRGELGRALLLVQGEAAAEARIETAELLRRAGSVPSALSLAAELRESAAAEVRSRAAALLARAALDRGAAEEALALTRAEFATPQLAESEALAALALGRHAHASEAAHRARLLARTDEQRARAEAVFGMIAHARAEPATALVAFRASSEFAARAGAVLEEATYQTGVAAAATDLGELGVALAAARRALLLFEHLGRGAEAARAALAIAAAFAAVFSRVEARDAALLSRARAKASGDARCAAYADLVLADVAERESEAREHLERAARSIEEGSDDELRVAARKLTRGMEVESSRLDQLARRTGVATDARLEWWGARAKTFAVEGHERENAVLVELSALARVVAPVFVRGAAFREGVRLATELGDGDAARLLSEAAADAAREVVSRVPEELAPALSAVPWLVSTRADSLAVSGATSAQLADVEALVRALGEREHLRSLLDRVLDALVLWTGVERGLLLLRAPNGKLRPRAARNLARRDLTLAQLALSTSLAERALREGKPVVAVDAAGDLPEVQDSVHALRLRSVLAVPLFARGEALGVVYLDDRVRRGAFGARELGWVRLLATLAALAIADARDQLLLRRAARRAERAQARLDRELSRRELELDVAERELSRVRDARDTRFAYEGIVGQSEALRSMLRLVDRVTASEVPVLIIGESGSGKELVARAIHENGPRAKQAFVSENCAAIPEALLESALFGHVKGAFTGASRARAGLLEIADRGTLLLDEIAEMSLGMQSKLLRVLQDGELRPVGSESARRVDVRVIGATHRDLGALVVAGKFREDLLYRLNVIAIRVPALRERFGDVPLLVAHFLAVHAFGRKVTLEPVAREALSAFAWPGNVRQLENELRRALVLADDTIRLEHLSPEVASAMPGAAVRAADPLDLRGRVDALEVQLVRSALRRTDGNQTRAAELLGLSRFGLQKMMKRLAISKEAE